MDFSPLVKELSQPTPSRDVIIEELDVITDPLRAGYPTTEIIDDLFKLFTKLISFSQWHIQQDTLSCTKYIFANSTLTQEQKQSTLLKHPEFTKQLAKLTSDKKREVREMAGQCIGQLAIQIGSSILNEEYNLLDSLFHPPVEAYAFEGQQMALGRLATAFRVISTDSLKTILPYIMNQSEFDKITNPSDNGYVLWYSSRALLAFVSNKLDQTLVHYQNEFNKSHIVVMELYKEEILKCAIQRLGHPYINVRRTAANVVATIFSLTEKREEFISALLPKDQDKWIQREGHAMAIYSCLQMCTKPLDEKYADELASTLSKLVEDPISCDNAPVTQKGNANGWTAKALTQIIRCNGLSFYEKYVHKVVQYLLDSPVAALLDAGVICVAELISIGGIDVHDLLLRTFKNICHASFPISDMARRIVPAKQLVEKSFDELVDILVGFGQSSESDVRESVCKALQMVSRMSDKPMPHSVYELATQLADDSSETVAAAALDVLRYALDAENATSVPQLVQTIISADGDDNVVAALRLLKSALQLYRDAVIADVYRLAPLLAFHAVSSMSPVVQGTAQQLLIIMAANKTEEDPSLFDSFSQIDLDSIGPDELDEIVEGCEGNDKAPATMLHSVIERFVLDLGGESAEELLNQYVSEEGEFNINTLTEAIFAGERNEIINKLSIALKIASEMNPEQYKKIMQLVADVFTDEAVDEKRPLLLGLDAMRRDPHFIDGNLNIPDPTPKSRTHDNETFSKHA